MGLLQVALGLDGTRAEGPVWLQGENPGPLVRGGQMLVNHYGNESSPTEVCLILHKLLEPF